MQQIQVNGADLLYLKHRKVDKKRLPEILVKQSKQKKSKSLQKLQHGD